jgi:hypothetical protein
VSAPLSSLDRLGVSIFDLCHYPYDNDPARYDPSLAERVYAEHMEEWVAAERLGFDCVFLSEHHFTAYNLLPSPNVMLGALAARTERIRLGVMVNVVPFHEPLRLAERRRCWTCSPGAGSRSASARHRLPGGAETRMDFDELRPRFQEGMELMVERGPRSSSSTTATSTRWPHRRLPATASTAASARLGGGREPGHIEWVASQGFGSRRSSCRRASSARSSTTTSA